MLQLQRVKKKMKEIHKKIKDDLKWVTKLDRILSDDGLPENQQKLTTNEKKMCNMLYRFYRD